MANQLRQAMEQAKAYYIGKLLEVGVFKHSDVQLYQLTLSEMKSIYKKYSS